MQIADGNAFDSAFQQRGDLACEAVAIERRQNLAITVDTFAHAAAQLPRHERLRQLELQVVVVVPRLASDREHVDESVCGQQPGARALALDHRIGCERRAVHQYADVPRRQVRLRKQALQPADHGLGGVGRRRQRLAKPERSVLDILENEIRKGAANVDADPESIHVHLTSIRKTLRMTTSIGQSVSTPSRPMMIISAMMSSVLSVSRDCSSVAPRPRFTPVNSPSTM